MRGAVVLAIVLAAGAAAQDPAEQAYAALGARDYDAAIAAFRVALERAPERTALRKDLAYTYLKVGENEAARDQFHEVMRLDPADHHAALEFAFLANETRQAVLARRVFDRVRKTGDEVSRATAEQAFRNIDGPLAESLERWRRALEMSPDNFSAHHELAKLAEQRDELELAAEHYERAWRLRPALRSLLVDLGRVRTALGQTDSARRALLAASRGAEARTAEEARALLPARYPYVYEFREALDLDPENVELRRELAYLHMAMENTEEAEGQFRAIVAAAPDDLLSAAQLGFLLLARHDRAGARPLLERVLKGGDDELADRVRSALRLPQTLRRKPETPPARVSEEARLLAERSLQAGYLKDALKYLTIAHENDPADFSVMLKLGWTHNILKQDDQAIRWFDLARRSPDPAVAGEAERAFRNLRPALARFRTTAWFLPFYSSRWHDLFSYSQVKSEIKLSRLPLRPYLSLRFAGDTRATTGEVTPQYLSESSFLLGAGVASASWKGLMAWGEAATAISYLGSRRDQPRFTPDYRAGVALARGFGHPLNGESSGAFFETNADGVYISRFQNDFIVYGQNRAGWTLAAGGLRMQVCWNYNLTLDARRLYWANFAELGPGLRLRWNGMPPSLAFTVSVVRGFYTLNEGNPRRPNYYDLRAGVWYAVTR